MGCSSRKVEAQKQVKEVSEITQNDIKTEKSEILESQTISNIEEKNIKATSLDPEKPSSLNITGNTLSWRNASVDITDKKEAVINTTTGTTNTKEADKSKFTNKSKVKKKGKKTERKSSSWGANLALIFGVIAFLILLFLYFKTKKPTP